MIQESNSAERERVHKELIEYRHLDTVAMVLILKKMRKLACWKIWRE